MVNEQIKSYIDQARASGASSDQIVEQLRTVGWPESDIQEAVGNTSVAVPALTPSRSRWKIVSVISVIGVLLLGGGAFGYYWYQRPERIVLAMVEKLAEAKTGEFSFEAKLELPLTDEELAYAPPAIVEAFKTSKTISFGMGGAIDGTTIEKPLGMFALYSDLGSKRLFTIESRVFETVAYLQLKELAQELSVLLTGATLNQWIRIDTQKYMDQSLDVSSPAAPKLTLEQEKNIRDLFKNSGIIENITKLPDETIKGAAAHHYGFSVSKEGLLRYVEGVAKIALPETTQEEIQAFRKSLESVSFTNGQISVGKKDKFLYRLAIDVVGTAPDGRNYTITFSGSFWNYNQPVVVEEPKEFKTLEEIMSQVLGNMQTPTL